MILLAQAVAEYGGLAGQNAGAGSLDRALGRLANATPMEYVLLAAGLLFALFIIMKLLDAA